MQNAIRAQPQLTVRAQDRDFHSSFTYLKLYINREAAEPHDDAVVVIINHTLDPCELLNLFLVKFPAPSCGYSEVLQKSMAVWKPMWPVDKSRNGRPARKTGQNHRCSDHPPIKSTHHEIKEFLNWAKLVLYYCPDSDHILIVFEGVALAQPAAWCSPCGSSIVSS